MVYLNIAMYLDIITSLSKIDKENESFKPDIRSKANNLLTQLLSYEII